MKGSSWQEVLLDLVVFLALVASSVLLIKFLNFGDGYGIYAVILSATLTLYIRLRTSSRHTSEKLELIVGPDTGTTDDSLSLSKQGSLLSRFSAILEENGQSWLLASDLLNGLEYRLEVIQRRLDSVDYQVLSRADSTRETEDDTEVEDSE